jgi:uncharacterized protein YbjQ (UPF0145 family)
MKPAWAQQMDKLFKEADRVFDHFNTATTSEGYKINAVEGEIVRIRARTLSQRFIFAARMIVSGRIAVLIKMRAKRQE